MIAIPHAMCAEETETRASFTEFVRMHGDCVWRGLHVLGVPESSIEDAAQDVFLIACGQWSRYEERGTARSWLFAITRRVAANLRRRKRPDPLVQTSHVARARNELDLEQLVARREARALVEDFMASLVEPRRVVFYLCDIEEWSAPEVAETLGIKLNTVYSRLRRARAQFETYLRAKEVAS